MGAGASLNAEEVPAEVVKECEARIAEGVPRDVVIQELGYREVEGRLKRIPEILAFVDGSARAHLAYLTAKQLVRNDHAFRVVTVESEKTYLGPSFKPDAIRTRYESDLVAFLPERRRSFVSLPKTKQTKDVVKDYVKTLKGEGIVVVGFSGRKTTEDRDPTVIGQVADLALRTVDCPCVVVKVPVTTNHHFVMLVVDSERCRRAIETLKALFLKEGDKLTILHSGAQIDDKFECGVEYIGDIVTDLMTDKFSDVAFVCVATRPKSTLGSVSDALVRTYKGNLIFFKDQA